MRTVTPQFTRLPRLPRLLPLAAAAMLLASPSSHAQWDVTPAVSLIGTWSDNIELRDDDEAHSQFVTELRPSLAVSGKSRRLDVNAIASWDRYYYSDRESMIAPTDSRRRYSASLRGTMVEQLLYVDATANRSQYNIQPFAPGGQTNPFSRDNSTEVSSWSVSPYLVQRFGRDTTGQLRYSRDSVEGDRTSIYGNSTSDTVLLNLNSTPSSHKLGWGLNYTRQEIDNRLVGDSSSQNVSGSLRYQFNSAWAATMAAGHDRYDFEGPGGDSAGNNWSVGGIWTPSARTSIQASVGRHLYGNTGSLTATVRSRRTVWDVQYRDVVTSSRSQFFGQTALSTESMVDRMFISMIPDPVQRAQVVAAYIRANNLPITVGETVSFLSNRWSRNKELRASVGWRGGRTTALASAYRTERHALSDQESDSPLLGNVVSSLNDNLRQHGVNLSGTYGLNSRSQLNAGFDYSFTESLTTGFESTQRTLYARVQRDFGRLLKGSLEARRRTGGSEYAGRRDYTENALVAYLTMTY